VPKLLPLWKRLRFPTNSFAIKLGCPILPIYTMTKLPARTGLAILPNRFAFLSLPSCGYTAASYLAITVFGWCWRGLCTTANGRVMRKLANGIESYRVPCSWRLRMPGLGLALPIASTVRLPH
jgi:hypothetical protein